jgi:hypothetical protein
MIKTNIQQLLESSSTIDDLCPRQNVQPQQVLQKFMQVSNMCNVYNFSFKSSEYSLPTENMQVELHIIWNYKYVFWYIEILYLSYL